MNYLGLLIAAYFLGGIPVGVLVARAYGVNIFEVGSGSIGATNVSRILGWKAWVFVFVPDVLKGVIPALVVKQVLPHGIGPLDVETASFIAGLAAVFGHCASPFLKFRGGKGVATALGAGLGAAPLVALSSFALFGVVLVVTRYMAIASVVGVSATMLFGIVYRESIPMESFYVVLSSYVALRHRKNFARLRAGTEPKFGSKKGQNVASTPNRGDEQERLHGTVDDLPAEDCREDGLNREKPTAFDEPPDSDERA